MGKRADTAEGLKFVAAILERMSPHQKTTAQALREQLKNVGIVRTDRSIQRTLTTLADDGYVERDDDSKPYGYKLLPRANTLAPVTLTPHAALLLRLAEEHLRHLLPASLKKTLEPTFAEAARVSRLPDEDAALTQQWRSKVRVVATSQPLLPPSIPDGVFEAVSEALYWNRWLEIDYQNAVGKRTKARVMPLGLVQQGERLYVVCRFEGRDNERNLALHRLQSARISIESFERPATFDLKLYNDEGRFGFGEGKRVRLTFRITKAAGRQLLETPLSVDQTCNFADDETLEISATVVDSLILEWWLRGFGDAVKNVERKPAKSSAQGTMK